MFSKRKLVIAGLALLVLFTADLVQATVVDFYEDGVIQNGDEYFYANVYSDATVDVTGGFVSYLHAYDTSTVNVFAGTVLGYLKLEDSSEGHLHGGVIQELLSLDNTGTVHFYGYDFEFESLGGSAKQGFLSGYWVDGTPFEINLHHWSQSNTYNLVFHEIPEPGTFLFLGLGAVLFRKRNHRKLR